MNNKENGAEIMEVHFPHLTNGITVTSRRRKRMSNKILTVSMVMTACAGLYVTLWH